MKPILYTLAILSLLASLASCRTTQTSASLSAPIGSRPTNNAIRRVEQSFAQENHAYRMASNVQLSSSSINFSSRVDWLIVKKQGIKASIRPVFFMEAARAFFFPDAFYLYDLVGKRKLEMTYQELSKEIGVEVSYALIEAAILGEFVSGANIPISLSQTVSGASRLEQKLNDGSCLQYEIAQDRILKTSFETFDQEDRIEIVYQKPSSQIDWIHNQKLKARTQIEVSTFDQLSSGESASLALPSGNFRKLTFQAIKQMLK